MALQLLHDPGRIVTAICAVALVRGLSLTLLESSRVDDRVVAGTTAVFLCRWTRQTRMDPLGTRTCMRGCPRCHATQEVGVSVLVLTVGRSYGFGYTATGVFDSCLGGLGMHGS